MIFRLFPYPGRLRAVAALLWLYSRTGLQALARGVGLLRLLPGNLAQMEALLPGVSFKQVATRLPERVSAKGERRARVALLAGCVQRVFFPQVNEATIRVLSAEGCEVLVPRGQDAAVLSRSTPAGRRRRSISRGTRSRASKRTPSMPSSSTLPGAART